MVDFANRRGSRDSGRDEPRRGGRDEPARGGRDEPRGGRDEPRGGTRSSGSGAGFVFKPRSSEAVTKRATMGANDYDKFFKDHIKMWSPNKGDNRIRIVPATWRDPEHYGWDIFVHYGVGADRGSYLDLTKMLNEPDPITEERDRLRRLGPERSQTDKDFEDMLYQMDSKRRVAVYLVDRDNESEGVQVWAMPFTFDKTLNQLVQDRHTGGILNIEDPHEGFDIEFIKEGEKDRTKYTGVQVARRSTPLGKPEWLDFAVDNPLPDQLQFYSYDEIAKVFGGGGELREREDDRDDERDRDRDRSTGRNGRDDPDAPRTDSPRNDRGGRGGRGGAAAEPDPSALTWESVHAMSGAELDALVEAEDLQDVNPNDANDDEELADWICESLKLTKAPERVARRTVEPPAAEGGAAERLRAMRTGRDRR